MTRYKAVIEYDGTPYVGFQVQKNGLSVQESLQQGLYKMSKGQKINVHGSGRTDSGVHAHGQAVHFDYPVAMNTDNLLRAWNAVTADSIRIRSVSEVEETFHARYHAQGKHYRYWVDLAKFPSPFQTNYVLHHPYPCDYERMNQALQAVVGEHNFKSFCSTKTDKTNFVRRIDKAQVALDARTGLLVFDFIGNGFLYNMVRILVGTSLQIGDGLRPTDEMTRLIAAQDRNEAGPTAPGHGLYLEEVYYPDRQTRDKQYAQWLAYRQEQKKS